MRKWKRIKYIILKVLYIPFLFLYLPLILVHMFLWNKRQILAILHQMLSLILSGTVSSYQFQSSPSRELDFCTFWSTHLLVLVIGDSHHQFTSTNRIARPTDLTSLYSVRAALFRTSWQAWVFRPFTFALLLALTNH